MALCGRIPGQPLLHRSGICQACVVGRLQQPGQIPIRMQSVCFPLGKRFYCFVKFSPDISPTPHYRYSFRKFAYPQIISISATLAVDSNIYCPSSAIFKPPLSLMSGGSVVLVYCFSCWRAVQVGWRFDAYEDPLWSSAFFMEKTPGSIFRFPVSVYVFAPDTSRPEAEASDQVLGLVGALTFRSSA